MDRLVAAVAASVDPYTLMRRIAEQACAFTPKADGAAISICTSDQQLAFVSAHGLSAPLLGYVLPSEGTFQGRALDTGQPQISHDAKTDPRMTPRVHELATRYGIRSWVVFPLDYHGVAVGALSVVAAEARAFSELDIAVVASTSRFVSALIGSHSELSGLLDEALEGGVANAGGELAAEFLASLLLPDFTNRHNLHDRLDRLMSDPSHLEAVYQPIVDLESGEPRWVEGLCRFPGDPGLSTAAWFESARNLGRGLALERMALRTVLDGGEQLPDDVALSVNVSTLAARDPEIQQLLLSARRRLVLEITEHEPFPDNMRESLQPLRSQGILLAIDDAGAGYASFSQILRLKPEIIKVDGELTSNIGDDAGKRALAVAVVQLAGELGALTVAESIEDARQRTVLGELGFTHGQGFFFAKPMSVAEAAAALRRR